MTSSAKAAELAASYKKTGEQLALVIFDQDSEADTGELDAFKRKMLEIELGYLPKMVMITSQHAKRGREDSTKRSDIDFELQKPVRKQSLKKMLSTLSYKY